MVFEDFRLFDKKEGGLGFFVRMGIFVFEDLPKRMRLGVGVGVGGEGVSGEVGIGESRGWGEEKGESKN